MNCSTVGALVAFLLISAPDEAPPQVPKDLQKISFTRQYSIPDKTPQELHKKALAELKVVAEATKQLTWSKPQTTATTIAYTLRGANIHFGTNTIGFEPYEKDGQTGTNITLNCTIYYPLPQNHKSESWHKVAIKLVNREGGSLAYNLIVSQYLVMDGRSSKGLLKAITTDERQFLLRLREFQEIAGLYVPEK